MPEQNLLGDCRFYSRYKTDDRRITMFGGELYCSMSNIPIDRL